MQIADNKVVAFHYTLTNDAGQTIDSSRQREEPLNYLHGHGNIIPGLEKALVGKEAGDKLELDGRTNVKANTDQGAAPCSSSEAMRRVTTVVLPEPGPASTSMGPGGAPTASRCGSFRAAKILETSIATDGRTADSSIGYLPRAGFWTQPASPMEVAPENKRDHCL